MISSVARQVAENQDQAYTETELRAQRAEAVILSHAALDQNQKSWCAFLFRTAPDGLPINLCLILRREPITFNEVRAGKYGTQFSLDSNPNAFKQFKYHPLTSS